MLEQEFDQLLAAYFEDELDDAGLARLNEAVRQTPARRRRYQRELRLHTLMRETAGVLQAQAELEPAPWWRCVWSPWQQVAALAACLAIGGIAALLAWNVWSRPEQVGRCLFVSEGQEVHLWRQDRQLPVRTKTVLREGDRIQTSSEAQSTMRLEGVGIVTLQGRTTLEVFAASQPVALRVTQGRILVEAAKRGPGEQPLVIRTPQTSVQVVGTVFDLEVEPTATRLLVHEGTVEFSELTSGQNVQVNGGQYSVSGAAMLAALPQNDLLPDTLMPGQRRLLPVADACLDDGRLVTGPYLKVEGGRRVSYLKFHVEATGAILGARLRLWQMVDPGFGTLQIWAGDNNGWSERTLSAATAPQPLRLIAQRSGWVRQHQTVELEVSDLIRQAGDYTLIVTLDEAGSNDIWFGAKESPTPPELILTSQLQ